MQRTEKAMNRMLTNSEHSENTEALYEKMLQDKDAIYRAVIGEIKIVNKDRIDWYLLNKKNLILKNIQPKRSTEEDEKNIEESSALGSLGLKPKPAI